MTAIVGQAPRLPNPAVVAGVSPAGGEMQPARLPLQGFGTELAVTDAGPDFHFWMN
jgi:hypothetical protein